MHRNIRPRSYTNVSMDENLSHNLISQFSWERKVWESSLRALRKLHDGEIANEGNVV